jgi:hypothetical protein
MVSPCVVFQQHAIAPACMNRFPELLHGINPALQALPVRRAQEAVALLRSKESGVVVVCIADKTGLMDVVALLASQAAAVSEGTLRVLVLNLMEHIKIPALLQSRGAAEVLPYHLSRAALSSKMLLSLQAVERALKRRQLNARTGRSDAVTVPTDDVRWVAPLKLASDCWLFRKKSIRFVAGPGGGSWLIEMMGPGPVAGAWKPHGDPPPNAAETGERLWEWQPTSAADPFCGNEGKWVLSGREPEFDWKINRYRFVGKRPWLMFTSGAGAEACRLRWEAPNAIIVSENSDLARGKADLIEATFDPTITVSRDATAAASAVTLGADAGPTSQEFRFGEAAFSSIQVVVRANGREARLLEWDPTGAILEVWGDVFSAGDNCEVWIRVNEPAIDLKRRLKITFAEPVDAGRWVVRVTVTDRVASEFEALARELGKRQDDVSRFFREARGH